MAAVGDRGFGIGVEDMGACGLGLGFRVSGRFALGVWGSRVLAVGVDAWGLGVRMKLLRA